MSRLVEFPTSCAILADHSSGSAFEPVLISLLKVTGKVVVPKSLPNSIPLMLAVAAAQSQSVATSGSRTESNCAQLTLPQTVEAAIARFPDLLVSCRLKPTVIRGDFDGDGHDDYALLVVEKHSRKRGFLIVFAGGRNVVAGAGRAVTHGGARYADLNFDDWELHRKQDSVESGDEQKPLTLHAECSSSLLPRKRQWIVLLGR